MQELAIIPTGRTILNMAGEDILSEANVKESILSIVRNKGLDRVSILAREARSVLDTLIQIMPGS